MYFQYYRTQFHQGQHEQNTKWIDIGEKNYWKQIAAIRKKDMEGTLRRNIEGTKQATPYFARYLALNSKGETQSIENMTYRLVLGVRT